MNSYLKFAIVFLVAALATTALFYGAQAGVMQLLDTRGYIAHNERDLMITAVLLMCVVMVPVLILTAFFSWWYRESNAKAMYAPNWEHGVMSEFVWWAIPFEIILILGALTWTSTHELDPRRPLDPAFGKPLAVQVVALNWKWLFIYPEEQIATVNYLAFPVDRPIVFAITSDAPMNSFWIPRLGGQIYAMTGMVTKLNLIADQVGEYPGASANYSGEGFAAMKFVAHALTHEEYEDWVQSVRTSPSELDELAYIELAEDSTVDAPLYFASVKDDLFEMIVGRFMPHKEAVREIMHE